MRLQRLTWTRAPRLSPGDRMIVIAVQRLLGLVDEDEGLGVERDAGGFDRLAQLADRRGLGHLRLDDAGRAPGPE